MIDLQGVTKTYPNGVCALDGVDLHIEKGEFVFVVGHSGAGKSTLIKTLLREVLGSARSRMDSSAAAFRSALGKPSVYCDFLEPLPVSYLADLMGITAESELSVRALAAAEQNGQVVLLLLSLIHI